MTAPTTPRPLSVLATLALQVAWPELVRAFERDAGASVETTFGPTNGLLEKLQTGAAADVAVMTAAGVAQLTTTGVLTGASDIGRSWVGLAVAKGTPKPDIATTEALVATLIAARAVAYSRIGASGVYFAGLIQRLGIAEQVNANAVIVPTGLTGSRLLTGEADIAIQQVSELKAVPGIDIVGALPRALQEPTVFTAAVLAASPQADLARRLIAHLASPAARPILVASGLEPI
jgi:molybdate transport system substrate-binding protein